MLKFLNLTLLVFLLVSCEGDDDAQSEQDLSLETNSIIGTWQWESTDWRSLTICEKQSTFHFKSDGALEIVLYKNNSSANDCEVLFNANVNWVELSENQIFISGEVKVDGSTSEMKQQVKFEVIDKKTLVLETYDESLESNLINTYIKIDHEN